MILLLGLPGDTPVSAVEAALEQRGAAVAFFDQRAVLETEIELTVDASVAGYFRQGNDMLSLDDITAVYLRPYPFIRVRVVEEAGPQSWQWDHALRVEDILLSWTELTPAFVVNQLAAMAGNASKPFQQAQIEANGFATPETLITTEPQAAIAFWERHGDVIYKSVSSIRSIVSRLTPSHLDHLDDIKWCPTQFQAYVPGTDYRVHVVGDELYACEITSMADDYRYASSPGARIPMRDYQLPDDCAARCLALANALELPVAGIDLRRNPDGDWFCFEVNSSPGFTPFQEATGQRIDDAIARLLIRGAAS